MTVTREIWGFNELRDMVWGQAERILDEISDADKEDDLMNFLESYYEDSVDETDLNDLLSYEWEWLYDEIGMSNDNDDDEEDYYEDFTNELGYNPYIGGYDYDC